MIKKEGIMFHKIYTYEQLSNFFRIANIMNVICLLSKLIYFRHIQTQTIIGVIIDNFDNLSLFITCLIIVSQFLRLFIKNYPHLIQHRLIGLTITLMISMLLMLVLVFNNDMQDSTVEYYSTASIAPHHKLKIIVLLIFIFIMLCMNLYHAVQKNDSKINTSSIKSNIFDGIKIFFIEFIVFSVGLTGIFNLHEFQGLSKIALDDLSSRFFLYKDILVYLILVIWITAIPYYLYKIYFRKIL